MANAGTWLARNLASGTSGPALRGPNQALVLERVRSGEFTKGNRQAEQSEEEGSATNNENCASQVGTHSGVRRAALIVFHTRPVLTAARSARSRFRFHSIELSSSPLSVVSARSR
jgi:hypothetical protein